MKYVALREVMVDGTRYNQGDEFEISHDKTARLVMLGYIEEVSETKNRAKGLDDETKPKTRAKRSAKKG